MLERFARFFSLFFLLLLPVTFRSRCCIFVARLSLCRAHAGAVDEKPQRLDERFKMSVQCDAFLDSISLQSTIFLTNRLARLLDFPRDFFTLAHICHVRFWLSIDKPHYDIANPIKSISISFICERTVFIYHYEFIFLLSTIVAIRAKFVVRHVGIHVIIVNVLQVGIILFEQDLQVRVVTYQMFRSSSDRDRSS